MKKLLFVALLASGLLLQADNSESHVEGVVKGILADCTEHFVCVNQDAVVD